MGQKDTVTAKYMRKSQVFADAFNYYVYHGEQKIQPEELVELDTKEIELPYGNTVVEKNSKTADNSKAAKISGKPVQKTRDVIKALTAMTDGHLIYLILGIENQSHIHYAMPVRNMVYDSLQYAKQVEEVIQSHRQAGNYVNARSDEFLSGFMKDDRLIPVLTLVVYWDSKAWDGPMSIHEMCRDWDEEFMALVPDYRINLLAPAAIEDDDFDKFHSSLGGVLSFIKYSEDKEQLREHILSNEGFRHMGRDEVNVLNVCVNAGISVGKEEEAEVDMCKALMDIREEGMQQGMQQGILESIENLMETMGWPVQKAMDSLKIPKKDQPVYVRRISAKQ